jgi:hypothetical protein
MTSNGNDSEFVSSQEVKLTLSLTPEQAMAMRAWSDAIPTMYMLDICVVNATKLSEGALAADARKAALASRLRHLDRPQNSFSYLLALTEKVSDLQVSLSDDELETQILRDVAAMRRFFAQAKIQEEDGFLLNYARTLRHRPPEVAQEAYLDFLRLANGRGLANPVARADRLEVARAILVQADSLSITRQHPTVLLTLACLYGNAAARKVMKFRADPRSFRAENALADIMIISRFLPLKLQIEQDARNGRNGFMRLAFLTDDTGLEGVLACFKGQRVRFTEKDGSHERRLDVRVEFADLLTEIGMVPDNPSLADGPEGTALREYDHLCAMLFEEATDEAFGNNE